MYWIVYALFTTLELIADMFVTWYWYIFFVQQFCHDLFLRWCCCNSVYPHLCQINMHLLINFTYLDQLRFGLLILARLSGINVDIKSLNEIVMHIERVINGISAYAPCRDWRRKMSLLLSSYCSICYFHFSCSCLGGHLNAIKYYHGLI